MASPLKCVTGKTWAQAKVRKMELSFWEKKCNQCRISFCTKSRVEEPHSEETYSLKCETRELCGLCVIARKGGETQEGQGARLRDLNKICCELWTGPFPPGRVGVQHRKVHFICEGFLTRRLLKWFTVGLRHRRAISTTMQHKLESGRIPLQTDRISTQEERIPLQKIRISTLQSFFHLESCIPFGQDSSLSLYMVLYISSRPTFNI